MSLYPTLTEPQPDHTFLLSVIKEYDDYLASEIESRWLLAKRHQRVANGVDASSLGIIGGLEVAGVALIFTGIGAVLGAVMSRLGMLVALLTAWLQRRIARKILKHARIMQCALDKRASIHKLVSDALRDGKISPEEFDKITGEVEQYNTMKQDIQNKIQSDEAADSKKQKIARGIRTASAETRKNSTPSRRVSISLALCTCAWT